MNTPLVGEPQYPSESTTVEFTRGDAITPEPIHWLWPGWLAAGKFHVLAGAPGTGKTTIGMAMVATVTTGGCWPDGSTCEVGNAVIWSGEDDPKDTLVPRLTLAGADLSRVHFVGDVRHNGGRRGFDPARDTDALERQVSQLGNVRLLIVDPIVSAITGDSHKNAEVRRGLQPLVDLASNAGCALLGITHLSKGTVGRDPLERVTGSIAFGAMARVVLLAAKRHEQGRPRLLCRAKSNIGPDAGGFGYELLQAVLPLHPGVSNSCLRWGAPIDGSARELLEEADNTETEAENPIDAAMQFLRDELAGGPKAVTAIKCESDAAGHSWRTIKRAKEKLGVTTTKTGMSGGWVWAMLIPPKRAKEAERVQQY